MVARIEQRRQPLGSAGGLQDAEWEHIVRVLVTGSAGYIGSHACLELLARGHDVVGLDDYSRGNRGATDVLGAHRSFEFLQIDLTDRDATRRALSARSFDAVLHFAALAYVGESVDEPLRYYGNNVVGSLSLLDAIAAAGIPRLIFSSTCATYGEPSPERIPIDETCPQQPVNPYGRTKFMVEEMIRDFSVSADAPSGFGYAALRYFNVAGSDPQARIGEAHDPETHLIPLCLQTALGLRGSLTVFGTDYPTPDGTCIRDYVHVQDLIGAHLAVLDALVDGESRVYNVGLGRGYSVRDVIDACRSVTGADITTVDGDRRPGDPPTLFANSDLLQTELGWTPQRGDLRVMVEDAWRWLKTNPKGYPA